MLEALKLFGRKPEAVKLDNGSTVHVRRISAGERLEWFAYLDNEAETKGKELELALNHQLRLLCLALCDAEGNRLFKDNEQQLLASIDSVTIQKLSEDVMRLNGFGYAGTEDVAKKAESTGTN